MSLNAREARKAGRYNRREAKPVGWKSDYPRIASLFGLDRQSDSRSQFAQAVHDWQAAQTPPLTKDGKLGPTTWGKLKRELDQKATSAANIPIPVWLGGSSNGPQIIAPAAAPVTSGTPRWFQIAEDEKQRWDTEIDTWAPDRDTSHPENELDWDERYFVTSPYWAQETHDLGQASDRDNRDWCAAFVNYCLHRAGYSHTGSAGASSFKSRHRWYFDAETKPKRGCVIVIGTATTGHASHVAFLDRWHNLPEDPDGDVLKTSSLWYQLLGGNQSGGKVSRKRYGRDLLSARGRNGVVSPYFTPRRGPHECNIGSVIPTEQAHHCHYPANED